MVEEVEEEKTYLVKNFPILTEELLGDLWRLVLVLEIEKVEFQLLGSDLFPPTCPL